MMHKFEDINIGDEVYFDSTTSQSNHELHWTVIGKGENLKEFIIQLNTMEHHDLRWILNIKDVRIHQRSK